MLAGKKILIGITGSIAAYKIPFLIRFLKKQGAEVQILMTDFATEFVTPLTLSTLSEKPVLTDFFDKGDGSWTSHVDLGLWADLFLVAPLSANTMAKMASGIADNLLLTTILSARCPIYFAPAMDLDMYKHPSTQNNIATLKSFGYKLIEPVEGELASGLHGFGRLEEPELIFEVLKKALLGKKPFEGKKALITAGPTQEPIDPVRYIGNRSSGKMGVEIALALAEMGADVDLILGPSAIKVTHPKIDVVHIETADDMHQACMQRFPDSDITVMAAAVADYTSTQVSKQKIKKDTELSTISLKPTVDILATMGTQKTEQQVLVGFALETDNEVENARKKLEKKNTDLLVLNSLRDEGAGFGVDTNKVSLLYANGKQIEIPLQSKQEVAVTIGKSIEAILNPVDS